MPMTRYSRSYSVPSNNTVGVVAPYHKEDVLSQRTTSKSFNHASEGSEGCQDSQQQKKKERKRQNAVMYRARKRQQTEDLQEMVRWGSCAWLAPTPRANADEQMRCPN